MKISSATETKFAQAVALAQNGRMKSTIHLKGDDLFILNMDSTILIHFGTSEKFPEMVSIYANDYESPNMEIKDGKICFTTISGGFRREKLCPLPRTTFLDVEKAFKKHNIKKDAPLTINGKMLSFLEDDLSHVEIVCEESDMSLIQRDIYTGQKITVKEAQKGFFSGPGFSSILAIRTVDFKALFTFVDDLTFYFQGSDSAWIYFEDGAGRMKGILSTCVYDEIGYINSTQKGEE
jgi:hypothetical protein